MADPVRYPRMTSKDLRTSFLVDGLYQSGGIRLAYVDLDRAIVGIAAPLDRPCQLLTPAEIRADYFNQRRELGVLNIGGTGFVTTDDSSHELDNLDLIYIGRGSKDIRFESKSKEIPAVFYLLSYPAHTGYPSVLVKKDDALPTELGDERNCNRRIIYKYIYAGGAQSCQLVMGVTHLYEGNTWNTMPAHTHMRRSEVYMYFDLAAGARVFHLMGPPEETKHIVVSNREVVVSPGWSIHAGVGTQAYKFCWGMGGENQDYTDMDPVSLEDMQ